MPLLLLLLLSFLKKIEKRLFNRRDTTVVNQAPIFNRWSSANGYDAFTEAERILFHFLT